MSDAEGGAPSQEGQPQQEAGTAEHWFAVMHSGAPTDQEVAAFTAWRRANPDHARAYHDLEQAWMRAGDHADHPEIKKMRDQTIRRRVGSLGRSKAFVGRWHLLSLIVAIVLAVLLFSSF